MKSMVKKLGLIVLGLKSRVKSAVARLILHTLLERKCAAEVVGMRRIDVKKVSPLVFDLTVEKHQCYLANGLLVSNSDAFLQLAVGLRRAGIHIENNPGVFGLSDGTDDVFIDDAPVMEPWQDSTGVFG